MENLTLRDKFLSLEKETKINRMTYFLRFLAVGVVFGLLPSLVLMFIFMPLTIEHTIGSIIVQLIYVPVLIFIIPNLIKKRTNDYDAKGTAEKVIMVGSGLYNIIITIYMSLVFIYPKLMIISLMTSIGILSLPIGLITLVTAVTLIFRKGVETNNNQAPIEL